jgi:hypothetical protein
MPKLGQIPTWAVCLSLFLGKHRASGVSARELLKAGMGTNLPTVLPLLRFWIIILASILTSITVQAHPGHEGGHDGDEFVWTADHLTRNPAATLIILATIGLIAWGASRFFSATQRQLKAAAARTQAADKTV